MRPNFKELAKSINIMSKQDLKQFLQIHKHEFLDEFLLRFYISYYFFGDDIIFNRQLDGTKFRPDVYIKNKNIIIEYDGPVHYTNNDIVLKDNIKDNIYTTMGLDIIRIPFFIEMSEHETELLFGKYIKSDLDICSTYVSGFIHKNVVLPSSFCIRGIKRYKHEMCDIFYKSIHVKNRLWSTLANKVLETGQIRKVFSIAQYYDIPLIEENIINDKFNILSKIDVEDRTKIRNNLIKEFNIFKQEVYQGIGWHTK